MNAAYRLRSAARLAVVVATALVAPAAAGATDLTALSRGLAVLEEPRDAPRGELRLGARLFVDEEGLASVSAVNATVEAILDMTSLGSGTTSAELEVHIVLAQIDGTPVVITDPLTLAPSQATQWVYRREIELPEDFLEAAIVVETGDGRWGATGCAFATGDPASSRAVVVHQATSLAGPDEPEATPLDLPASVVRILPPRKRPATGRTTIDTLIASSEVERVVFHLNGRKVGVDDKAPFSTVLDLGETAREHELRASAYAVGDLLVGEDRMLLNERNQPFEVVLGSIEVLQGAEQMKLSAAVSTPSGVRLERVEFLYNDEVVATLAKEPFAATLPYPYPRPEDFVAVRAFTADGEMREDARLVSSPATSERVEVNLVEIYTVVTDKAGRPVEDLRQEDFTIVHDGREIVLERFAYADEVPLVLGLIIDTSESMWPLMPATKQAGSKFLASTLIENDRAFLVDFDTRPRLAHETTPDITDLLRTFKSLRADGFTAIYDALLFSLLQFEQIEDRRALVLLTDGDDVKSQHGRRRVIDYGRELGVPTYFIGLAGVQNPRAASQRKLDLEGIAKATGGRVHYISQLEQLDDAYAQINAELRSQYVLAFSTDHPLSDEELDKIKVKVGRSGLEARAVIGRQ